MSSVENVGHNIYNILFDYLVEMQERTLEIEQPDLTPAQEVYNEQRQTSLNRKLPELVANWESQKALK